MTEIPDSLDPTQPKDLNSYMENYFWDEQSQLERRIAVGDKDFLKNLSKNKRQIMIDIIKDIQKQILTHNSFARMFRSLKKQCENDPSLLRIKPDDEQNEVNSSNMGVEDVIFSETTRD